MTVGTTNKRMYTALRVACPLDWIQIGSDAILRLCSSLPPPGPPALWRAHVAIDELHAAHLSWLRLGLGLYRARVGVVGLRLGYGVTVQ